MSDSLQAFEVCLPNWCEILPSLSVAIGASYEPGAFEKFEETLVHSQTNAESWTLDGSSGCSVTILVERSEGYLFGTLRGNGVAYEAGKELLARALERAKGTLDSSV